MTTTQRYTHLEVEDLQEQVAEMPANRFRQQGHGRPQAGQLDVQPRGQGGDLEWEAWRDLHVPTSQDALRPRHFHPAGPRCWRRMADAAHSPVPAVGNKTTQTRNNRVVRSRLSRKEESSIARGKGHDRGRGRLG